MEYTAIMKEVRKTVTKEQIKASWVYKFGTCEYEFQCPPVGLNWFGYAENAHEARANGWLQYICSKNSKLAKEIAEQEFAASTEARVVLLPHQLYK